METPVKANCYKCKAQSVAFVPSTDERGHVRMCQTHLVEAASIILKAEGPAAALACLEAGT